VPLGVAFGLTFATLAAAHLAHERPAAAASPTPAASAPAQAAAGNRLRQVSFADGTGTIGLAPGWQTNLSTCAWGVVATGPADQRVVVGTSVSGYLPSSPAGRQMRSLGALLAPYGSPADMLRVLGPQLSRLATRNHIPPFAYDNIVEKERLPPMFPGGRSAMVSYGVTEYGPRGPHHYRALSRIDLPPLSQGSWMLRFTAELRAPDGAFDRELPLMLAMANSWHGDDALMARRINGQTRTNQRQFDANQREQKRRSADFDNYIANQQRASDARIANVNDMTKASNDRLRSANDFDEYIRGTRTIEDTRTGQRTSVDLGNVDKIVDGLNDYHADPERYRQIPLRDEAEGQ
jgi:hypothetical protein